MAAKDTSMSFLSGKKGERLGTLCWLLLLALALALAWIGPGGGY